MYKAAVSLWYFQVYSCLQTVSRMMRKLCFCLFSLVVYLNAHTGIVFLRFHKKYYRLLWSALPFITCIDARGQKIPCFLNCIHVGGEKNLV